MCVCIRLIFLNPCSEAHVTETWFVCEAIVSFGKVSDKQKEATEELGVTCFSWEEFVLLVSMSSQRNA